MMTHAVVRDVVATVLTISGSLLWVKLFDELARREILEAKLSRKLVHVTSGTFFAMTWCLFGDQWYSKAFATLVPSLQAFRLFAIGSGLIENKNAVRAVSRGGGKEELLYGPFYYTIVLMVTTLLFWRESPVGFLVVSLMCGGDGVADIVGRRLGKTGKKWPKPFDERKSFAGSAAMVIAGMSLIGVPGTAGFISKWLLVQAALDAGWWPIAILIVASSLLAVIYIWRMIEALYLTETSAELPARQAPLSMVVPLWIMALACIYFGFDSDLTLSASRTAAEGLLAGSMGME